MLKHISFLTFIVLIISSCSKKDGANPYKLDADKLSLHYNETHQFSVTQGNTAVTANSVTWTSSDLSVATINSSGLLSGKKIGTTTITCKSSTFTLKSTITITPYSTICVEPYFQDGASKATTKSREFRTLKDETETILAYNGENGKVLNVVYEFSNGSMSSAIVQFVTIQTVADDLRLFLNERYTPVGVEDDVFYFYDNVNTIVGVAVDPSAGLIVIYFKGTVSTQNKITPQIIQQMKKLKVDMIKHSSAL